ncbi:hypothetical protein TNIN_157791 [Trichonephila inaurata madagascariensis]|uniref:Uncharacterized protein n=1 Tax=Trichonephila inaurata madagascariensis TaxID=2747483 RepID=A0A8X6YSS5_9ARAC|nr:hypothetical protein TNIN_157791 [Trichonephila inaurata madagascariensis]
MRRRQRLITRDLSRGDGEGGRAIKSYSSSSIDRIMEVIWKNKWCTVFRECEKFVSFIQAPHPHLTQNGIIHGKFAKDPVG